MLNEALKKQVKIAAWQFGLGFGVIIGYLFFAFGIFFMGYIGWILGGIIVAAAGIAQLVLWILGIVNAAKINTMTGDSIVLIVFSIITFWFGHLIVAVAQKNRFANTAPIKESSKPTDSFEAKLKESFVNGVISSAEYEKKLKEHRTKK